MAETFYGPWSVAVASKAADFDQRLIIRGSDASDGIYPGMPGTSPGTVTGAEWTLEFEWNDNAGSDWQPSDIRRSARYTVLEGLVVDLGAEDNYPNLRDGDYDDVVATCRSEDPAHTPLHPVANPYDFTVPEHVIRLYREQHPDSDDRRPNNPDNRQHPPT